MVPDQWRDCSSALSDVSAAEMRSKLGTSRNNERVFRYRCEMSGRDDSVLRDITVP